MQFGKGLHSLGGSKHGLCRGSEALIVVLMDGLKPAGVRHTKIAPAAFL